MLFCNRNNPDSCSDVKKALILSSFKNLSPETRSVLKKLDALTLLAVKGLPPDLIAQNVDPYTNEDITTEEIDLGWQRTGPDFYDWQKTETELIVQRVSPKFTAYILSEDEFFGKYHLGDFLTHSGLSSSYLFPMVDTELYLSTSKEALSIANDLDLVEGKALPVSYNTDFDMLSDESFSRIFFYSICAPLVAVQKLNDPAVRTNFGPFVVDMPMQDLPTRPAYRPYGARIHFGKDQIVTAIFDYDHNKYYKPGDEGWDEAKLLAKVSAFTLITAREHLIWTHLVLSNSMTTLKTLTLPPSHPIRRLLTIFTFRATEVNQSAFGTLVVESGILHRAVGLEYEGLEAVFDISYEQCNIYEPFPERKVAPEISEIANQGKFPYITQGCQYWNIVQKFVSEWMVSSGDAISDEYALEFYNKMKDHSEGQAYVIPDYSEKNMINLLTQCIFVITAHHELVGNVVDYVNLPSKAGFRLLHDHLGPEVDVQSWLLACLIGASTAIRMPALMRPFDHFFGEGGAPEWERDVWNKFLANMESQSKKVQVEDKTRTVEFKYFDPARFECSVSV